MQAKEIIAELRANANPENVAGMARYGINPNGTLGISIPLLRAMAKRIGRDHALAEELWQTGVHEARTLASMVDDPAQVTSSQMDRWVKDFDSWDVCDQVCDNLFCRAKFAAKKALSWPRRKPEFIRRAGFTMMAMLAVHNKRAGDALFLEFLELIERGAGDERNYVKKAANWALRNIGKRNKILHKAAIATALRIAKQGSPSARWIAADALRELAARKF